MHSNSQRIDDWIRILLKRLESNDSRLGLKCEVRLGLKYRSRSPSYLVRHVIHDPLQANFPTVTKTSSFPAFSCSASAPELKPLNQSQSLLDTSVARSSFHNRGLQPICTTVGTFSPHLHSYIPLTSSMCLKTLSIAKDNSLTSGASAIV